MNDVAVVGVGLGRFGNRSDVSFREIAFEAASKAFDDAGISPKDIDFTISSIAFPEALTSQSSPAATVVDYLGLVSKGSMRVEAACASGSAAIRAGYSAIKAGLVNTVLILGVEKMNEVSPIEAIECLARASDVQLEYEPYGITFAGFYAMMARMHMSKYGTTEEDLAKVAVKNHKYGAMNEFAHLRKAISIDDVLKSRVVASPLKLYDCSPITDGAACVILSDADNARKITDTPIWLTGLGAAAEEAYFAAKSDLASVDGARQAADLAYRMAKVKPSDIDVAEVHDCFTIAELMAYEDLRFCEKGQGPSMIRDGQTEIGGKLPVNLDGGLKSKGHPIGATGVAMTVEITHQLRGECRNRQAPKAEIGLTHNVGNTGQYCFVHIYSR